MIGKRKIRKRRRSSKASSSKRNGASSAGAESRILADHAKPGHSLYLSRLTTEDGSTRITSPLQGAMHFTQSGECHGLDKDALVLVRDGGRAVWFYADRLRRDTRSLPFRGKHIQDYTPSSGQ